MAVWDEDEDAVVPDVEEPLEQEWWDGEGPLEEEGRDGVEVGEIRGEEATATTQSQCHIYQYL